MGFVTLPFSFPAARLITPPVGLVSVTETVLAADTLQSERTIP
jgi:hypothetical protein